MEQHEEFDVVIVGAGPAGLMAADVLAGAGRRVLIAEAKPSPARKFLMAGKSGLNLTNNASQKAFLAAYGPAAQHLGPMLEAFGPAQIEAWASDLGQKLFTGSTGRVFPVAMKASPLLRAWLARMQSNGAVMRRNWRWAGWANGALAFVTPDGPRQVAAAATVLAMGGASWQRLGSDGAWVPLLQTRGVEITPFQPSNMGFAVNWSAPMSRFFGKPVKSVALRAGDISHRGEFVISSRGVEGGGIYAVSQNMRAGQSLHIDLLPDRPFEAVHSALEKPRGKQSTANFLRKALNLSDVKRALLMEFGRPLPDGAQLAGLIKNLPLQHEGPFPMDEAISTAGGVSWASLDRDLMLKQIPGVYCAGEMVDWEAPTGGYLLTACLSMGHHAGRAVLERLR